MNIGEGIVSSIKSLMHELEPKIIRFAQNLVRTPSNTGEEKEIASLIYDHMQALGYDHVFIDELGNVIGMIGDGPVKILFDGHIDTVSVNQSEKWSYNPYGGEIVDGRLYGRGAADMKGGVAASIYAGHAIKRLGLHKGKTIIVSASVMEEDFDGEALYHICKSADIKPDYVVICEPSSLNLALGHQGRALLKVTTKGMFAHGSAPEKGINAIYKMESIIRRVEDLNHRLTAYGDTAGSVALTKIESNGLSLNTIPSRCSIYLDRRLSLEETENYLKMEMAELLDGTDATWEIYVERGVSYTGVPITLHSFLPAWEIENTHQLSLACAKAYHALYKNAPGMFKWDICTNGVATAGKLRIPTIGFGSGDCTLAHKIDEWCPVSEIVAASEFYTILPGCF